jgi:hypothetical protein
MKTETSPPNGFALRLRTSKYGIGRLYTETAAGHDCIAPLKTPAKKGGINESDRNFFSQEQALDVGFEINFQRGVA